MPRKVGDYNKLVTAENPTRIPFKLIKSHCSDDLFTMAYCTEVCKTLTLPSEDEVRDWIIDNLRGMTRSHLACAAGINPSYLCRWLKMKEFHIGYGKILKMVDYLNYVYRDLDNLYLPNPIDIGDFLRKMMADGFIFADPKYIEWKFRVTPAKCVNFFFHELSEVQNVETFFSMIRWTKFVRDEYYTAFCLYRDGLWSALFVDEI